MKGTEGLQIVGMDVEESIGILNKAFTDEWLAYYRKNANEIWLYNRRVSGQLDPSSRLNESRPSIKPIFLEVYLLEATS